MYIVMYICLYVPMRLWSRISLNQFGAQVWIGGVGLGVFTELTSFICGQAAALILVAHAHGLTSSKVMIRKFTWAVFELMHTCTPVIVIPDVLQ